MKNIVVLLASKLKAPTHSISQGCSGALHGRHGRRGRQPAALVECGGPRAVAGLSSRLVLLSRLRSRRQAAVLVGSLPIRGLQRGSAHEPGAVRGCVRDREQLSLSRRQGHPCALANRVRRHAQDDHASP
jgi:hypothetical protein